ncbi:MAG: ECF-type sigma factor [Planctomycetota bacterium JB042]
MTSPSRRPSPSSEDGSQAAGAITRLLHRYRGGDVRARDEVVEQLYGLLRRIAGRHAPANGHDSLPPTALVSEAYIRLFKEGGGSWNDRAHFLASAAKAMRCIVVDRARARGREKRSAEGRRVPVDDLVDGFSERARDIEALDEALERLARVDEDLVKIVEHRFFAGLSMSEVARAMGKSLRQAEREWRLARIWLERETR